MPPKDTSEYRDLWEVITKILISQERIEALLIGQDGSGICARVKALEDKPVQSRNFWATALIALVCAFIGTEAFNYLTTTLRQASVIHKP